MPDSHRASLYEQDFFAWTQEQAARLRELRGVDTIDIEYVAEELEDLGRERRDSVQSSIERLFEHLLKLAASPSQAPRGLWRREARSFAKNARRKFSPGMRQHIDMASAWVDAVKMARDELSDYGETLAPTKTACPFSLDEILDADLDLDWAVARVKENLDLDSPQP